MRVGDDAASAATVRQLDACCLDWHDGATHAGTGDVRTKCGLAVKSQCSCYGSCVERYFRRRCVPVNQVPQCIVGYCRRELVSAGPISSAACFRRGSRVVLQAGYLLTGFCKSYSGGGFGKTRRLPGRFSFSERMLMSIFASFPKKTNGLFPSENSTYFLCTQKD